MAAQLFMEKTDVEIKHIATETLEGHQRAIMGNMTIEVVSWHAVIDNPLAHLLLFLLLLFLLLFTHLPLKLATSFRLMPVAF